METRAWRTSAAAARRAGGVAARMRAPGSSIGTMNEAVVTSVDRSRTSVRARVRREARESAFASGVRPAVGSPRKTRRGDAAGIVRGSGEESMRGLRNDDDDDPRDDFYRERMRSGEDVGAIFMTLTAYLARAVALVLVADVAVWRVTLLGASLPFLVESFIAFLVTFLSYYGIHVARWRRSIWDVTTHIVAAAAIGSSAVIFVTAAVLGMSPRPPSQIIAIIMAATLTPLLGVYVTEIYLHRHSKRRSKLRILSDSSHFGAWCTVAGTLSWAYSFNANSGRLDEAFIISSLTSLITSVICRYARASYILFIANNWTTQMMFTRFTKRIQEVVRVRRVTQTVQQVLVVKREEFSTALKRMMSSKLKVPSVPISSTEVDEVDTVISKTPTRVGTETAVSEIAQLDSTKEVETSKHSDDTNVYGADEETDAINLRPVIYAPPFTFVEEPTTSSPSEQSEPDVSKRRRRRRKRQYRRRQSESKLGIDMSDIVSKEINISLNIGVSIEAELQRALEQREATLRNLKEEGANSILTAQVQSDIDALRKQLDKVALSRTEFDRARTSYENDLEMWMESIRAAAAVSRLDFAIDSLKSASVRDDPQIKELIDQRAVWGLRLVSSQIFTIVELQDCIDKGHEKSTAHIADLRRNIQVLEHKISELNKEQENSKEKRTSLESRLERITAELETVRERERTAHEDWQKERVRLEIELETSVKELQTATRTVDEALQAKRELLAQLKDSKDGSVQDAELIKRLEHETGILQDKLQSLSDQLAISGASVDENHSSKIQALESKLRAKLEEADATAASGISVEFLRDEIENLRAELSSLKRIRAVESADAEMILKEQLAEAQSRLEIQRRQLEQKAEAEISALRRAMDDVELEMEKLASDVSAKTRESLEYQRTIEVHEAKIRQLKNDEEQAAHAVKESKEKLANLQDALMIKQQSLDEKVQRVTDLELRLSDAETEAGNLQQLLSESQQRSSKLEALLTSLQTDRNALSEELASIAESHHSELTAAIGTQLAERDTEIARVQSELAETKLSLESERDALQARLVELSSAQDEELTTALAAQLSERESEIARVQSELTETKSQLESERDALRAELSSVSSSRDAELSALRAELEGRVSDRESEIARVQSELAETKLSLESERTRSRLVWLSCRLLKMRS